MTPSALTLQEQHMLNPTLETHMTMRIVELEMEAARLRYHLTELGKFADRAGLVLATIEGEDSTEDAELQEIIDGISTWAAPAILGEIKGPNARSEARPACGPSRSTEELYSTIEAEK